LCGENQAASALLRMARVASCLFFIPIKKSELLCAFQTEIQKHNLSNFMHEKHKVVMTGCSYCRKHFRTVEQFKFHTTGDVLPPLLDGLSSEVCKIV
jgi:hypothetical protein